SLGQNIGQIHGLTLIVGVGGLALLWVARRWLKPFLQRLGLPPVAADLAGKASPLLVIGLSIGLTSALGWSGQGLAVVGDIPQGLPSLVLTPLLGLPMATVQALVLPALLIALMTFIEQISIAQGMAARRRERVDVNAEMRAMGGANLAAGLTGAFAIGASFSRTSVVAESGGRTPATGIITALLLALTALFLTPWLHDLPMAVLAATILISLGSLLDLRSFPLNWRYARADFAAQVLTFSMTLLVDLVTGLTVGVIASLALHLWRSSRPHIAVVGNVPGTEHYRNVLRHAVITHPHILGLRVDESLFFANARFLEDRVSQELASHPAVRHVVLQCTAVNEIDASALESLRGIHQRLQGAGVKLHLSEVKGPVMDRLRRSDFLNQLSGQVFLTHHQAVLTLRDDTDGAVSR
ncbi:MAG: SulP family inorganic anion transporter, partial [Gammaproteobacteria bacterium]